MTITVSNGASSVIVPGVEGQPEDAALNVLQGRGLTNIRIVRQETDDEDEDGRVLDQAPPAGTRVRAGDRVTIFVGEFVEPEPVQPPPSEEPLEPGVETTP